LIGLAAHGSLRRDPSKAGAVAVAVVRVRPRSSAAAVQLPLPFAVLRVLRSFILFLFELLENVMTAGSRPAMKSVALISGVPRAGKSSLCDAVVERHPGFTHVPLDRYVRPVPRSRTFLDWIATPTCIAWDHLLAHIAILESGSPCYTPRPDWDAGRGDWISEGGAIDDGPGRRMEPARIGYLIPGTHAFAFPPSAGDAVRIFVETPAHVIAARLAGKPVHGDEVSAVIRKWLGENCELILAQSRAADRVIDGTAPRPEQIAQFVGLWAARFELIG
jgi:hypothetical protein